MSINEAIDDEAKETDDVDVASDADGTPPKRIRTSKQTGASTEETAKSNDAGADRRPLTKIDKLAMELDAETAASKSSMVGGSLIRTKPKINKADDPDKVAMTRIMSVIRAAILSMEPTKLEEKKSAEIVRFVKDKPELSVQSLVQASKQRAAVSKDLRSVLDLLDSSNSFIRVNKVTKKMTAIPLHEAAVTQPAAASNNSARVNPAPPVADAPIANNPTAVTAITAAASATGHNDNADDNEVNPVPPAADIPTANKRNAAPAVDAAASANDDNDNSDDNDTAT